MPQSATQAARTTGRLFNTGVSPSFLPMDIGHREYVAVVEPDSAFWALVRRDSLGRALAGGAFADAYMEKAQAFAAEMDTLRFGLTPSAVYFNPTERCNLNCPYCYLPAEDRKAGRHMSHAELFDALGKLEAHFTATMPAGRLPQIVFHGAEPLLNREAVFAAIDRFGHAFRFGVQTNATLLDREAVDFLVSRQVGVGISLDAADLAVSDRTRQNWAGSGQSSLVIEAMERLAGYPGFNVICTITRHNVTELASMVDFLHGREVPACMLNAVRCTRSGAQAIKPDDALAAAHFTAALDKSLERFDATGRKLVVANFANILLAIMAPTARRLMCDISPCGGGRCFFAVAATGDMFPCGEFIGLPEFKGGNIFTDPIPAALESPAFAKVTGRKVEDIARCRGCAIRHFCGAPCPAEALEFMGGLHERGAFCRFYEEQTRYALRQIADGRAQDFLWDGWDDGVSTVFALTSLEGPA